MKIYILNQRAVIYTVIYLKFWNFPVQFLHSYLNECKKALKPFRGNSSNSYLNEFRTLKFVPNRVFFTKVSIYFWPFQIFFVPKRGSYPTAIVPNRGLTVHTTIQEEIRNLHAMKINVLGVCFYFYLEPTKL